MLILFIQEKEGGDLFICFEYFYATSSESHWKWLTVINKSSTKTTPKTEDDSSR